ncbi:MAG: adenosylmethionine decarboxylase [Patescibacteria group bacterium]
MAEKKNNKQIIMHHRKNLGVHLITEFWGAKIIEDVKKLERVLVLSAKKAGSTPLKFSVHKFSPHGITATLLLAESHIAFHSWPEFNYLAIDVFTCGESVVPERAIEYLKKIFLPKKVEISKILRGKLQKNLIS